MIWYEIRIYKDLGLQYKKIKNSKKFYNMKIEAEEQMRTPLLETSDK